MLQGLPSLCLYDVAHSGRPGRPGVQVTLDALKCTGVQTYT